MTWKPSCCQMTTAATDTSAWSGLDRKGWGSMVSQVIPRSSQKMLHSISMLLKTPKLTEYIQPHTHATATAGVT